VLCETEGTGAPTGTTCPANEAYPKGTKGHANLKEGTHLTLTAHEAFKPNVTCKQSTIEGETNNEGGATEAVTAEINAFTFEECGESEVKVLNKGSLEIEWISGTHEGTLKGTGQEFTTVAPSVFGTIHCIYRTSSTDLGKLTGSSPATINMEEIAIPKLTTSSLCPSAPTLDAEYAVTSPNPLFVASHT